MDEEWVKKVLISLCVGSFSFLFIYFLFSFGSRNVLKQTQSPDPANSTCFVKMVWDGFEELKLKNTLAKK